MKVREEVFGASSVNKYFVYDGANVVLDFVDTDGHLAGNAPALDKRYFQGPGVDQLLAQENVAQAAASPNRVWWVLPDHLGSTRDVVTATGGVIAHFQFDSFGNILDGRENVTRYQFQGREHDSNTDLNYHRARWCDPLTGKWMSEDPIGFSAGDANVTRDVGNGVLNGTDPSGLFATVPEEPNGPQTSTPSRPLPTPADPELPEIPWPTCIPGTVARHDVSPSSPQDTFVWAIAQFATGNSEVWFHYSASTRLSARLWRSDYLTFARDWLYKGARTFLSAQRGSSYDSGIQTAGFSPHWTQFFDDAMRVLTGVDENGTYFNDYTIKLIGGHILTYHATIDCETRIASFHGRVYNVLSIESASRNPFTRKPVLTRDMLKKVYMPINIKASFQL